MWRRIEEAETVSVFGARASPRGGHRDDGYGVVGLNGENEASRLMRPARGAGRSVWCHLQRAVSRLRAERACSSGIESLPLRMRLTPAGGPVRSVGRTPGLDDPWLHRRRDQCD